MKPVFHAMVAMMILLTGCAGHHVSQGVQVNNPHIEKARRLNRSGVVMLGQQHPVRASSFFGEAIKAATLADNAHWVALSWYNLGRARATENDKNTENDKDGARHAYQKAMAVAEAAGDAVNVMRARLALALLDDDVQDMDGLMAVDKTFPVDVQLAAGQLAAEYDLTIVSEQAFERVLVLSGKDRAGLLYAARAHLGLAGLAMATDAVVAARQTKSALVLLHKIGAPRLMKQALQLAAKLEPDAQKKQSLMQRVDDISYAMEPLAKVASGDFRPRAGVISSWNSSWIPSWNFGKWNHHSSHSNSKSHSKRDCNSSTQTFASGSMEKN